MINVKDLEGYNRELPQKAVTLYGKAYGILLDQGDIETYTDPRITFNEFRFGTEDEIEEDLQYYEDGLFEFDDDHETIVIPFTLKYHGENEFKLEERASKIAMENYRDQSCSLAGVEFEEEE